MGGWHLQKKATGSVGNLGKKEASNSDAGISGSDALALSITHLESALRFADVAKLPRLGATVSDALAAAQREVERKQATADDAKMHRPEHSGRG